MFFVNFLLDHIPLWVYVVVIGATVIAAMYYLSPILIPLWNITPTPIKIALGFVVAIVGAVLGGRYKGAKDERDAQARRDAEAIQKRQEVDNDVNKMSDEDAQKKLRDRWGRD